MTRIFPRYRAGLLAAALLLASCAPAAKRAERDANLAPGLQRVELGGVEIAYHVYGRGPVLIAHPGGPGAVWDYLRTPTPEEFATVVYVEPVGTGNSGPLADPNGYTIPRYVADLEGLRAHLGLEKVDVLGHSHGGMVAQAYAIAHPDRVRHLILYDTSPTTGSEWQKDVAGNLKWFEKEPWYREASEALAQETSAKTDDDITAIFCREMPLCFAEWTKRSAEFEGLRSTVRFAVAPGKSGVDTTASAEVGVAPLFDSRDRLSAITAPTLVIVGARDFVCSPRMAAMIHAGIPGSRLHTLEHSGHMGHVEEPAEFARTIREFLREAGAANLK